MVKKTFLLLIFFVFGYFIYLLVSQKTRAQIKIYGEDLIYFSGELYYARDNYSAGQRFPFRIMGKDSVKQLFSYLSSAKRTNIDNTTGKYATITLNGYTENRIYCFHILLTYEEGCAFDQNDCEAKYFKKVIGSFSNPKIADFFQNYFMKNNLNLDSLRLDKLHRINIKTDAVKK